MSSSRRTSRATPGSRRSSATRWWSRTCAAMRPASRCFRWWMSSAVLKLRALSTRASGAALGALAQPGDDAGGDLVRPLAARVHADVPGVDSAAGVVAAAEAALHGGRGPRRHDVIAEGAEIPHRLNDGGEVHPLAADPERAADQAVLLVESAVGLGPVGRRRRRRAEYAAPHAHEVLERSLIAVAGEQAHVLLL